MRRPKCGCRSENLASSRRPLFHSTFEINFIDPEQTYPVIAVTSRLMSTGFNAQTCKLIVLDRRIASMTEFKQSKKRNIFTKYGDQARAVLEALLQKYADSGITSVESMDILKVDPLTAFGTPMEIVKLFGDKESYLAAIRELEQALYHEAA